MSASKLQNGVSLKIVFLVVRATSSRPAARALSDADLMTATRHLNGATALLSQQACNADLDVFIGCIFYRIVYQDSNFFVIQRYAGLLRIL